MKASELRIGNLIQLYRKPEDKEKTVFQVTAIDSTETTDYVALSDGFVVNVKSGIEPIPLTKEWLIKFGFDDMINGVYIDNKYQVVIYKDILGYYFEPYQGRKTIIEYVHQLQNLYFALTGEEL